MAPSKKRATITGTMKSGTLRTLRFLTGAAIVLASYLAWISFSSMNAVGCGPDSGCQAVLNSKWAYFMGIPVSLLGLIPYAVLFLGTFQLDRKNAAPKQRSAWLLILPAAILAAGGALWFTGIQMFVIKKFCPYCMVTHALALLAGAIVLIKAPFHQPPEKHWQKDKNIYVLPKTGLQLAMAALLALAVMSIGQGMSTKKTFVEKALDNEPTIEPANPNPTNSLANAPGVSPQTPAIIPTRLMELFNGEVSFNLHDVPLYGKPDAPHVMVSLHDYTCKHCRTAHGPLMALNKQFSNELAIVSFPMPLDATCNRVVPRTPRDHTNACQYAALGLAVWRANPEALDKFENYVFGPTRPPSLEQTRAYATDLVGATALNQAMSDPWVNQQLKTSVTIYAKNYQKYRQGSMPQFIIGTNVVFGFPEREFLNRVTNQFGLTLSRP